MQLYGRCVRCWLTILDIKHISYFAQDKNCAKLFGPLIRRRFGLIDTEYPMRVGNTISVGVRLYTWDLNFIACWRNVIL